MNRARTLIVVVLLVVFLVPAALAAIALSDSAAEPQATPTGATASSGATTAPSNTGSSGGSDRAPLVTPQGSDVGVPTRVRIPSLDVVSGLEMLRTDRRGQLEAPRVWQRAGWFADGTRPGSPGPAVIAGHVDSPDGPAVFARLDELRAGDVVEVQSEGGGTTDFRVDRTQVAPKGDFPTAAVYGPTPDAQLRLITCDGPYVETSGGYQDNLVIFASEVG